MTNSNLLYIIVSYFATKSQHHSTCITSHQKRKQPRRAIRTISWAVELIREMKARF